MLLVFSGALMFWYAWDKSATYDEVQHIQCGYYHWKHLDFERGLEHVPLIRLIASFPLNFLKLRIPKPFIPFFSKNRFLTGTKFCME